MRVLWVTQAKISISQNHVASGGWTVGALKGLVAREDIEMHYAFLHSKQEDYCEDGVHFWSVAPLNELNYPQSTENDIYNLLRKINPDVIHCWGTETPITIAAIRAAKKAEKIDRVVINIQGMLVYCSEVLTKIGIPWSFRYGFRPIELLTGDSLNQLLKSFRKRVPYELEAIGEVSHIVGRTPIDKTFALQLAPQATYHFCNETLREMFYDKVYWSVDKMQRHSIFMSEVQYPIKSLEKMLEALAILAKKYDDVQLYIAGQDMFCESKLGKQPWDSIPSWLKRNGYQSYLYRLANKMNLVDRIHFIGRQDAAGMKAQYLKANVYVCSSIVENESNSLSEAMITGSPCVAAYVGGVTGRISDGVDGFFYPWNEPWQMADRIMQIFDNDNLAESLSKSAVDKMAKIVDRQTNLERMLEIYKEVAN